MDIKHKKAIGIVLKCTVLVLLCWSIFDKIFLDETTDEILANFWTIVSDLRYDLLLLVLLLMPLNWGIEALKWRLLIDKIEQLSFIQAFKAICSGITLAMFTPNRIGEFGGRVLLLKKASKLEGIAITLIGSLSQIVASFSLGFLGWIAFNYHFSETDIFLVYALLTIAVILTTVLLIFYYNIHLVKNLIDKLPYFKKWQRYFNPVVHYNIKELTKVLSFSALRYMVFSFQYFLLFQAFGIELGLTEGIILIFSIFFMQTIIPSIAIVELGIRGKVALYFMAFVNANPISVLSAALLLWGINLLVPALIGAIIIFGLKNILD